MLPAAARLRHRNDFRRVVAGGRRGRGRAVVVHLRESTDLLSGPHEFARVGFVVSRAVGGAVTRNTVRRRLRHVLAARLSSLPHGSDVVVRALPTAAGLPSADLATDLDRVLSKLGHQSKLGRAMSTPRPT